MQNKSSRRRLALHRTNDLREHPHRIIAREPLRFGRRLTPCPSTRSTTQHPRTCDAPDRGSGSACRRCRSPRPGARPPEWASRRSRATRTSAGRAQRAVTCATSGAKATGRKGLPKMSRRRSHCRAAFDGDVLALQGESRVAVAESLASALLCSKPGTAMPRTAVYCWQAGAGSMRMGCRPSADPVPSVTRQPTAKSDHLAFFRLGRVVGSPRLASRSADFGVASRCSHPSAVKRRRRAAAYGVRAVDFVTASEPGHVRQHCLGARRSAPRSSVITGFEVRVMDYSLPSTRSTTQHPRTCGRFGSRQWSGCRRCRTRRPEAHRRGSASRRSRATRTSAGPA